ncbi:MAG TPA: hypothetical protein VHV83_21695 [Armatimonadota bacterium]|nr:hypothetical protein [Armatimonadota bacterium]
MGNMLRMVATAVLVGLMGISTAIGKTQSESSGAKWSSTKFWYGGAWTGEMITVNTYDSKNRLTESIVYGVSPAGHAPDEKVRTTYIGDDSSYTATYMWDKDSSDWRKTGGIASTLNAEGKPTRTDMEMTLGSDGMELTMVTHTVLTYRPDGKLLSDSTWMSTMGMDMGAVGRSDYTYTTNTMVQTSYSLDTHEPVLSGKVTTTYDNSQHELIKLTEEVNDSGKMVPSQLDSSYYDGSQLCVTVTYNWSGTAWTPYSKTTYYTTDPPDLTGIKPLTQLHRAAGLALRAQAASQELMITYMLPVTTTASLALYDLKGALVARIMNPRQVSAGSHVVKYRVPHAASALVCKLSTTAGSVSSLVIGR